MPTLVRLLAWATAAIMVAMIGLTFCNRVRAAEPACFTWQEAMAIAKNKWGEVPTYIANAQQGMITITLNPSTGSFTAWIQPNSNTMCAMVTGDGWQNVPAPARDAEPQMYRLPDARRAGWVTP